MDMDTYITRHMPAIAHEVKSWLACELEDGARNYPLLYAWSDGYDGILGLADRVKERVFEAYLANN